MPVPQTTQWLTISDFSPGIQNVVAGANANLAPHPLGSATDIDANGDPATYDCFALPGGGLGCLPFCFTALPFAAPAAAPDAGIITNTNYGVVGLHVPKFEVADNASPAQFNFNDYTSLIFAISYTVNLGAGVFRRRTRVYRYDSFTQVTTEIQNPAAGTPAFESPNLSDTSLTDGFCFVSMCDYRTNGVAAPTTPGPPYVMMGVCDPNTIWTVANGIWQYPDPANPLRVKAFNLFRQPTKVLSHQGRLVMNGRHNPYTFGQVIAGFNYGTLHTDDVFWTVPNQDTLDNGGVTSSLSQATVGIYGAIASSNANELVLIRASSYGGLVVTSDLNSPIVADYASMQGTNGCHVDPVWTPMGLIYGALNDGIYVYSGGGRTQSLSPNMDNGFWHSTLWFDRGQGFLNNAANVNFNPIIPVPHLGKFAYHGGFVFVPGCWLYDINSNNWWRFRVPADADGNVVNAQYFDTSVFGNIYAAQGQWKVPGGVGSNIISSARMTPFNSQPAFGLNFPSTYKWTSNLIPIAKEDEVNEVRELVLVLEGETGCSVKVTLNGNISSSSTWNKTFVIGTGSGIGGSVFRTSVQSAVRGTHVTVILEGTAGTPNTNFPPSVFRVDLGLAQQSSIPKQ